MDSVIVVNKKGIMHQVSKDVVFELLKKKDEFRLATKEEIKKLSDNNGNQTSLKPLTSFDNKPSESKLTYVNTEDQPKEVKKNKKTTKE